MANATRGNVWVVDTSGAISTGLMCITGVKLKAGSDTATVTIKTDDSSGTVVYEAAAATTVLTYDQVEIRNNKGFYVTLTGTSPKVYIYFK